MSHIGCDGEGMEVVCMKRRTKVQIPDDVTIAPGQKFLRKDEVTGAQVFQGPGLPVLPQPDLDDMMTRNRESRGRIGFRGSKGAELTKLG